MIKLIIDEIELMILEVKDLQFDKTEVVIFDDPSEFFELLVDGVTIYHNKLDDNYYVVSEQFVFIMEGDILEYCRKRNDITIYKQGETK